MRAHIFRRAKNAMQSGQAGTDEWVLQYEVALPQRNDPLMGWAGSGDTRGQVILEFPNREEAISFARAQGLDFDLQLPPPSRPVQPKVYAENFRYGRYENWTH